MLRKYLPFIAVFAVTMFIVVDASQALRITLKRIVFEGPKRAEVMTILNNTDEPKTYRLGWRHYRMTSQKSLVDVPDDQLTPDIKPVVDMVRFAPRRFTIPPNSSQQIRLMLRTPGDLPDGEYRSHLWIRPEAEIKQLTRDDAVNTGNTNGVKMTMLAGITTPVIVRKGNLEATASIELNSVVVDGGSYLTNFSLIREGNKSIYGDFKFTCNPGTGSQYDLRSSRGVAVYPELNKRNFSVRIPQEAGQPACSVMSVAFYQTEGYEATKGVLLAEAKIQVSQ